MKDDGGGTEVHIWKTEDLELQKIVYLKGYIMDSNISACGRFLIVPTSPLSNMETLTYAVNLANFDVGMINLLDGDYHWFFPFAEFAIVAAKKEQHILQLSWDDAVGYAWY